MMDTAALALAFAAMLPLMVYVMYQDLKNLRIPNWTVLAVFGIFLATGSWGLPFETFLWRVGAAVAVIVIGFTLYAFVTAYLGGKLGGGDVKMIAALVPFVAASDVLTVMVIYVFVTFVALAIHSMIRRQLRIRETVTGWDALDDKIYFPVGLILGVTILTYLGLALAGRF